MKGALVYFGPLVYFGTPEVEERAPEKRYDYTLPLKINFKFFFYLDVFV